MQQSSGFQRLVEIMERLRGPQGCPWDHEQTYASLRRYLLEECFEVAEALDLGDPGALAEELGDLLFQIVFLAQLATEEGQFTIDDVIRRISEKMVRRHPHVFGSARAETAEQVIANWETIKRQEKETGESAAPASRLDGVPAALPALLKAHRLGESAARVGFDWDRPEQILDKVDEELGELRQALAQEDPTAIRGELGDLMFSLVMLARRTGIDPEAALEQTNRKFRSRFVFVERELTRQGTKIDEAGLELLEQLWSQAKERERPSRS